MINPKLHPVEWASLMYELEDAKEHLASLIDQMNCLDINEEAYEVQLGHVFAHLNRSWNTRNRLGEISDDERARFSLYPVDLKPYG